MSVRFAIYSSGEVDATLKPDESDLAGLLSVYIDLGRDPLNGTYDLNSQPLGRGSRIFTIGGFVQQDFGIIDSDRVIKVATESANLTATKITKLKNAFEDVDGKYYFTDGVKCWLVQFAKPGGFMYTQDLRAKYYDHNIYNYELTLNVVSEEI